MTQRRILVLSDLWLPFPGGAERLIYNVARDLAGRGHDVHAVTGYRDAQQFDGPSVEIHEIPLDLDGWVIVAESIARFDPDVILTHHLYAEHFAMLVPSARMAGIPIVRLHHHGPRPDADLVVHISQHVAVASGVWPAGIAAAVARGEVAAEADMILLPPALPDVVADRHGDAIGFVKPIRHKGAELVYAIAEAMPEREFVVLRGEWQTLELIRPDLPNVRYLQPVDDMRDFYSRCRLVLMPSLSEDAGTVAQEATANGLPCISSDAGGLVETNAGGIRIPPALHFLQSWCDVIRYLDDPDHYRDVVRSQAEALPDWSEQLDELAARIEAL